MDPIPQPYNGRANYRIVRAMLNPRTGRKKSAKATWLAIDPSDDSIALRYHETNVLTWHPDGTKVLNSDGWQTVTTRSRINDWIGEGYIYQRAGIWYFSLKGKTYLYKDGLTIGPKGKVSHTGGSPKIKEALTKKIDAYVNGYMNALRERKVPAPSNGDCWDCLLREKDSGKTLGELIPSKTHLHSHMKEKYYVPSLLMRAIEVFPVSQMCKYELGLIWGKVEGKSFDGPWASATLSRSLKRYIRRQLDLPT